MANLRGWVIPDRVRRGAVSSASRLADRRLTVRADTWQTFATLTLSADGSGSLEVRREDGRLLTAEWTAEDTAPLPVVEVRTVGDPGMSAGIIR